MKKIVFLFLTILFLLNGVSVNGEKNEKAVSPKYENTNIIFISIDTLRNDHLGCYGYKRETSKNIDDFAEKSVLFENFITQAAFTPISQMSIFTSQEPRVNGMTSYEALSANVSEKTLPSILKYYGYTNAAFLGCPEFIVEVTRKDGLVIQSKKIFGKSFDVFEPADTTRAGIPGGKIKFAGERENPEGALQWLKDNKDKKFFLWIPIGTVHWPYARDIPPSYKNKFDAPDYTPFFYRFGNEQDIWPKDGSISYNLISHIYKNVYYFDSSDSYNLSEKDIQHIIGRYDAGIYYTDEFIGRLFSLVESLGLSDNTIIVLHSIHGEDLGEHGYFTHYDIYDTEVKNALIIKFPGSKFKGKRILAQAQGLDIMPTLLDYLDIPINHEAQGINLMPLIENDKSAGLNEFVYSTRTPFWEYMFFKGTDFRWKMDQSLGNEKKLEYGNILRQNFEKYDPQYPPNDIAIRTNDWKLILRKDKSLLERVSWWSFISRKKIAIDEIELYDLKNDPFEQKNIASEKPDITAKLKEKLLEWDSYIEKHKAKDKGKDAERILIPYPY
ncbi:MAG: sulfatase-like hydrolase/transferase [bacterium]|nr:sulfatase-like hydrolase/transferase [bacterium]